MKVKALQSIGKWLPQGVIEVIADAEFDKLVSRQGGQRAIAKPCR